MGLVTIIIEGGVAQDAFTTMPDTDNIIVIDVDNLKEEGKSRPEIEAIIKTMTLLQQPKSILDYRELSAPGGLS